MKFDARRVSILGSILGDKVGSILGSILGDKVGSILGSLLGDKLFINTYM